MTNQAERLDEMSDEDLLNEFAGECEGESRRISSDPPSRAGEYYGEILRRMVLRRTGEIYERLKGERPND